MTADVLVERSKACTEVEMIIGRQQPGVRLETEGAKGACQAGHFAEQLLRMHVIRQQKMPQDGDIGVQGVQEPVMRNVTGRHASLKYSVPLLLLIGKDRTLLIQ